VSGKVIDELLQLPFAQRPKRALPHDGGTAILRENGDCSRAVGPERTQKAEPVFLAYMERAGDGGPDGALRE
jgi:hypothetical protein